MTLRKAKFTPPKKPEDEKLDRILDTIEKDLKETSPSVKLEAMHEDFTDLKTELMTTLKHAETLCSRLRYMIHSVDQWQKRAK